MRFPISPKVAGMLGICFSVFAVPTVALTQEESPEDKAISQRRGLMQLISGAFGPLAGMAKGEIAYDAEAAELSAANLRALTSYNPTGLFLAGTSNADKPGKTRAQPAIWSELEEFVEYWGKVGDAAAKLADAAGQGQEALAAAVGETGKACGECHDDFRAKDF
jgi:cytochrome c556